MPIYLIYTQKRLILIYISIIMPIYSVDIGKIIQERRKELSLKQQDLAEMANVTIKTIYAIENNKGNPTIEVLKKVLDVLGLEINVQIKLVE